MIASCGAADSNSDSEVASDINVQTEPLDPTTREVQQEASTDIPNTDEVTVLSWEDLMPDGEEERLEELYAEFYQELESRLLAQESTLSSTLNTDENLNMSRIAEGSDMDTMEQIGTYNVVEDLHGMKIRLPGYIVPLDFSASDEHRAFLLVPYFGACLHSPPPPPNQIVFVTAEPPAQIPDIYDPVWLEGTLTTGKFDSELGNSAYELSLSELEPYEY